MPERICRWGVTLGAVFFSLLVVVPVSAALPVEGAAATADYWLRPDGDAPLLRSAEAEAYAHRSTVKGLVRDLVSTHERRSARGLRAQIHAAAQGLDRALPELYAGEQLLREEQWQAMCRNCGVDTIGTQVTARPAVAVRRADVRLLPTEEGWYEAPDDVRYDALQGTVLDPGEAVLRWTGILPSSRHGTIAAGSMHVRLHTRTHRRGAHSLRRRSSSL